MSLQSDKKEISISDNQTKMTVDGNNKVNKYKFNMKTCKTVMLTLIVLCIGIFVGSVQSSTWHSFLSINIFFLNKSNFANMDKSIDSIGNLTQSLVTWQGSQNLTKYIYDAQIAAQEANMVVRMHLQDSEGFKRLKDDTERVQEELEQTYRKAYRTNSEFNALLSSYMRSIDSLINSAVRGDLLARDIERVLDRIEQELRTFIADNIDYIDEADRILSKFQRLAKDIAQEIGTLRVKKTSSVKGMGNVAVGSAVATAFIGVLVAGPIGVLAGGPMYAAVNDQKKNVKDYYDTLIAACNQLSDQVDYNINVASLFFRGMVNYVSRQKAAKRETQHAQDFANDISHGQKIRQEDMSKLRDEFNNLKHVILRLQINFEEGSQRLIS